MLVEGRREARSGLSNEKHHTLRQMKTHKTTTPEQALEGERFLTVEETAQALGLCLDSVRRHLRSGRLQGVRVGRSWRIPQRNLLTQLGVSVAALGLGGVEDADSRTRFMGSSGDNRSPVAVLSLGSSGESAPSFIPQSTARQPDEDVALALLKSDPLRGRVRALLAQTADAADLSARSVERLLAELDDVLA